MNDKSIIGFGYKPNNAKAVCLKTDHETLLGDVEYKIIADPYEREFVRVIPQPLSLLGEEKKVPYKAMAVNVLDTVTGLTYAVEYEPANLVRKPKWFDVEIPVGGRRLPVKTITRERERKPSKLVGRYYKPEFLMAFNLETNMSAHLGNRKYCIISEPYVKKYSMPHDVVFDTISKFWSSEHTWIDVVDSVTNNKYAVPFLPSGICEEDDEPTPEPEQPKEQHPAVMDSDTFLRRMKEIAQEIDDITDANPDLLGGCSVAFFAANKTNAGLSTNGVSRVCGNPENLVDSISIPAKKNKDIAEVIGKVANKLVTW